MEKLLSDHKVQFISWRIYAPLVVKLFISSSLVAQRLFLLHWLVACVPLVVEHHHGASASSNKEWGCILFLTRGRDSPEVDANSVL